MRLKPLLERRFFGLPLRIAKLTEDDRVTRHDPGVGGKNHVRQARDRHDPFECCTAVLLQHCRQGIPLHTRHRGIGPPLDIHPGIDLVGDLIMIRWAHQEAAHSFHPKWRASSRRNDAASITRPMACKLPRSASLVGTAGFTSTQTVGTEAGNKLPVATACSVEATNRADRKSTRLNSSHQIISYAVFCLKKKKKKNLHT